MIRIAAVTRRFADVVAVDRVDLHIERGETVALLGPSGCGKTTLLRLIAGFERPDEGTITIDDAVVAGPGTWTPPERRRVGMVFQDYALFPHLDVARNVGFGLPRRGRDARVAEVLELVGLAGLGARRVHELSGGQQQRVALARALAPSPSLILLDEPWSSSDPVLRAQLREDLMAILRRAGATVLLVTHDREEAFTLADRVALMHSGRVVQVGRAEDAYYQPVSRWAAEFVGAANFVRGRLGRAGVDTPLGCFVVPITREDDADVDVLVRPELVELLPDPHGSAQVIAREFRGHDVFYRVRLADGSDVCAQRPSNEQVALGDRVAVRVHDGPVTVFD